VAIEDCITTAKLQRKPEFVLKVIQFFETLCVRFGVMLVGPTGSGKTENWRMLQAAQTKLRAMGTNCPGDAKSSLGDAKSSLGDAKSSLTDAKSSLGDAKRARWVTLSELAGRR
jgi:hypothetical protein